MLIKRVVIQGFKTFAKKTEFVFDPGVTAIVGPNGSGKSNVSDAIRWCLGEQSFSLLRSKKTSDIIFSGSDQKSRLGMAQVTVTLDNSAGEMPVDFAEVEITRRAYRDGDNEYLINGQRVRLQDITELLSPSGLGKRTYALIGQGLIDRMLSMSPEELRTLFEEAAGITAYQMKRASALRRLEASEQNLTRVQDIIAEISPRLGYLRRQAERAREREQIAGDLRDLLHDWYGYHWHTTLHQYGVDSAQAEALRSRVETHRHKLAVISAGIEHNRERQAALRAQLGELHRLSSGLHSQAEQTGRQTAVSQERLRQVTARAEEARQEAAALHLQHDALAERIARAREEITEYAAAVRERQTQVESLQAAVSHRQQARERLQQAVTTARRELVEAQSRLDQLDSRRQQIAERSAQIIEEEAAQETGRRNAAVQVFELSAELEATEMRLSAIEGEIAETAQRQRDAEASIAQLRQALEESQTRRRHAERESDRLQTRHDLLSRLREEGAGYASGVREVLQAAQEQTRQAAHTPSKLSGVVGTIASVLRVPATLDKAIETALGGAYQNVVTHSWNDAQQAIEYLKSGRRGRATFLPLDRLDVLPPIAPPDMPGVLGNAADLVGYDAAVAPAVQQMLNRVWIVDNLTTARRALDANRRGPRPTVVTLEGEIVRPGGAVSGGSDTQRRDDSILARERELRELPSRLQQASALRQERAAECDDISARIDQLQTGLGPLQVKLAELARLERSVRDQSADLHRRLDRAGQAERWHIERLQALEAERIAGERQSATIAGELSEAEAQHAACTEGLRRAEKEAEAAGAGELLQQLADLRAAAAEARGTLQSHEAVIQNQERSLALLLDQINAKERQVSALQTEAADLSGKISELTRQEEELSRQIAQYQSKIEPLETTLAQAEAEQSNHEAQERSMQEALRSDESAWNTAQLKQQRTDDALRQLRHDIEQDLGLVFLEESADVAYQPPLPWETIVEQLEPLATLPAGLDDEVREMRARLSRVRNVNPDAPREYEEAAARCSYLESQSADLSAAIADLRKVIAELDTLMQAELTVTFDAVAEQFVYFFNALFNGGAAKLVLLDPDNITTSGIEIVARPPGKRPQSLALLSGGERSLAACALLFAILRVSPTPFCVLDEVDAALDEANVDRFRITLDELSRDTQFIIITHNRRTLENTNAIYGVTMGSDGASRVISLRLEGERIVRGESGVEPPAEDDDGLAVIEDTVNL